MILRTMDDRELVAAYVRDRSETAFGELVGRHLAWVYSVALRHTGNPALAEDVAQSVFVLLARKAGSLRSQTVLGGWLFQTTRFVANRALRAEKRRREREEKAASMIPTTNSSDDSEAIWKQLESCLDQAVASLSETDRQAILLRFYQKKSLVEVGQCLGLSEDAAKKRVSRAIQKMRDFLLGRGIAVGATVLAGLMAEQTVQAAPPALAGAVLNSTAASIASSGVLPQLAQETLKAWQWTKSMMIGALTASLCGLAWLGFVLSPHSPSAPSGNPGSGQDPAKIPIKSVADSATARTTQRSKNNGPVLHLRVVAKDTSEPVSGATLAVNTVSAGTWKQRFDLSTDETGSADIPYPAGTGRLDVGVVASGWTARFASWWTDYDAIPAEYTLRIARQTNVMAGWLKNDRGEPVPNAVVEMEFGNGETFQDETPRERPGFMITAPVAVSGQNGWWSCAVIDPATMRIPGIRARHPKYAPTQIISERLEKPQSLKLLSSGTLVTTMKRGVTLTGRIVGEGGELVDGARLEHEPSSSEPIVAQADLMGWFQIPGLPPGDFDFIVTAPHFAQTNVHVTLKEGMEPVEIRLKPGGILRLLIVDREGNPIENATAALTGFGGMYMPGINWSAQSGPDGKIEWTSAQTNGMLNGMLTICASKDPDFGMSRVLVKADGEEHVIRLHPRSAAFAVTGRVFDARTGQQVSGEIKAFPGYGNGMNNWYRGETRRSTNGTFRVTFGSPGNSPWRFRIEAEGYAPFVSEVQMDSASGYDTNVFLQAADPSKAVHGTVFRTDDQPAARAQVALLTPEHGTTLGRARFAERPPMDRWIVDTDQSGNFSFPEEPGASFVVAVCSNGFARVPVSEAAEIHLQPWGRIEGAIDPSARTHPADRVMVDDIRPMETPGFLRLAQEDFSSKPSEDGQFSFDFLPQGQLCVWLYADPRSKPNSPAYHHPVWIQVRAGETTTVKVTETGCHVKGRLVLNGREINGLKQRPYVVLTSPESADSAVQDSKRSMERFFQTGFLMIEPDGRFESWDCVDPGTYRLQGTLEGIRLDQPVEVPDSQFNSVSIGTASLEPNVIDLGDIVINTPVGVNP